MEQMILPLHCSNWNPQWQIVVMMIVAAVVELAAAAAEIVVVVAAAEVAVVVMVVVDGFDVSVDVLEKEKKIRRE